MKDIQPCPLCRRKPYFREAGRPERRAAVWCFGEYGHTPGHQIEVYGRTDAEAVRTWNKLAAARKAAR